jgi:hypothetical protein
VGQACRGCPGSCPGSGPAAGSRCGGGCGDRGQRDAGGVGGQGALQALFAAVHRAAPGHLAAAGGFGDAAVDGQVVQLQAEDAVVGGQHQQVQPLAQAERDPLVAAAPQGGGRAGGVFDAAVAAAEDQDLDELVEDDAVGDAGSVAAQGVGVVVWGQQGGELVPQGLDDAGWQGGHGFLVGVWWHMPRMQANPCLHSQIGLPRLLAQPLSGPAADQAASAKR